MQAPSASASETVAAQGPAGSLPSGLTDDTASRSGDFRKLLVDASAAKNSGDLTRAASLYQAARDKEPTNIEALSGLADVARMRGDSATAGAYYDTVLKQNPTYLPALISSADIKWAAGDKATAVSLYKRVVAQSDPGSSYGQRAAARIAESGGGHAESKPAPEPRPATEPKPTTKPAAPSQPESPSENNIDTSDLPGFKR
jgi:tetratricopeptide (TPR) repeat protein